MKLELCCYAKHNNSVTGKKRTVKKHIGKERTGKKRIMYISAWEKSALGKKLMREKRTRKEAHTEKKSTRINPHWEKTHMYRQENTTRKIIFISLLNSEQRHSFVLYFTLFIKRQLLFLSLCSL